MPQRRVIRRELEPFAKKRRGARPVFVVERLDPARLVTLRTLEKVAKLHDQGIGRKDWSILAESKVRVGLAGVAEPSIRHGERIMSSGCPRVLRQHRFEM